jgi:hypothetical protein
MKINPKRSAKMMERVCSGANVKQIGISGKLVLLSTGALTD